MALLQLYIDNFRGFSNSIVPIRNVSFLVGENSSGKSSFLSIISVLSNFENWLWNLDFVIPEHPEYHFLDMVSAGSSEKSSFTIGIMFLSAEPSATPNDGNFYEGFYSVFVTYRQKEGRPNPSRVSLFENGKYTTVEGDLKDKECREYSQRISQFSKDDFQTFPAFYDKLISSHNDSQHFKSVTLKEQLKHAPPLFKLHELSDRQPDSAINRAMTQFGPKAATLAPIRAKPKRLYDAPHTRKSSEGDDAPYRLQKLIAAAKDFGQSIDTLTNFGEQSGLYDALEVMYFGQHPRAPFEVQVKLGECSQTISNVGYGVSQILPVLVEGVSANPEKVILIQQPEVHLHPKAQSALGDFFADLARGKGMKLFIETHSDFLIDRFRRNISQIGPIPSQVLYFERINNNNIIHPIVIDDDGNLDAEQPESYRSFFIKESLSML